MSDSLQNFEYILRQQNKKKPSVLYCDSENLNQTSFKSQDVISSVSHQLKAIQDADSSKRDKKKLNDLRKYKKAMVISVSNLSLVETEPLKQATKFDTQCISDTQLLNVIEDAEILAAHQGMTQYIETAFLNTYTEIQSDKQIEIGDSNTEADKVDKKNANDKKSVYDDHITFPKDNIVMKTPNNSDKLKILDRTNETAQGFESDKLTGSLNKDKFSASSVKAHEARFVTETKLNKDKENYNIEVEQLSQVLVTKTNFKTKKCKSPTLSDKNNEEDLLGSEIEKYNLLNMDIEINNDVEQDKPLSPIFKTKVLNTKSPSPLVVNLDQFEHFESIAMSLLESNSISKGKYVINSQILNKELCFNTNKEVKLLNSHIDTPNEKGDKGKQRKTPVLERDKETIETEKEIVENIDQKTEFTQSKTDTSKDLFKTKSFFSSDEENDYINKEGPNLPFTCALESSFYDQSDVLDKTVYVGFQTASNRSIQVGADAFAKAKSILGDVTCEEITVTELVQNCDDSIKEKEKTDTNINKKSLHFDDNQLINSELIVSRNQVGFMTANNKRIELSEKALARCKKIFQDIDLDEKFDDNEYLQGDDDELNKKESKQDTFNTDNQPNTRSTTDTVNNILEGFDDEILKEFVNVEMSLKDSKEVKKSSYSEDVTVAEIDNIVKEATFHEQINKICKDTDEIILSQILGSNRTYGGKINANMSTKKSTVEINDDTSETTEAEKETERITKFTSNIEECKANKIYSNQQPTTSSFLGFRTANNNKIKISEKAWLKSKTILNDIDSTEFPQKGNKVYPKESVINDHSVELEAVLLNKSHRAMGFVGFRTASNRNIEVSHKAVANTKSIFNDINLTDVMPDVHKEHLDMNNTATGLKAQPEEADGIVHFKSASDKIIKVSEKAIAQTKTIFDNIDPDLSKTYKENKDSQTQNKTRVQTSTHSTSKYTGFKTANNGNITISKDALAKTKDIFSDVDSVVFERKAIFDDDVRVNKDSKCASIGVIGFQTASNKQVKISEKALAKSRKMFQDFETNDGKLSLKTKDIKTKSLYPEEILQESEVNNDGFKTSTKKIEPFCKGFETASKKPLEISKVALEKSKKLFKDLDEGNLVPIEDLHFEENKETAIYKESTANNILNFQGFQTASKKPVPLSKEALENSKKLFKDLDDLNLKPIEGFYLDEMRVKLFDKDYNADKVMGFKGFQTASKKPVTVSKAALEKTKNVFKDLNEDNLGSFKTKNEAISDKDKDEYNSQTFKGFQTASKKAVAISKDALEKSKKLFKNIGDENLRPVEDYYLGDIEPVAAKEAVDQVINVKGFQTASHQKVTINEQSLAMAKQIFNNFDIQNNALKEEIGIEFQTGNNKTTAVSEEAKSKRLFPETGDKFVINTKKKDKKTSKTEDVDIMLDTQVLNNFEKSLYTEDFAVSSKTTKRSASPILSCPRAKKRKKFEVPYNLKQTPKSIPKPVEISSIRNKTISYRKDYKKNNMYTLKDLDNISKNMPKQIDPYLLSLNYENLVNFEFNENRNDLSNNKMNIKKLKEEFTNSVNAKLIPNGWLENHIQQILWKLISYEIKFKSLIVCTARNVLEQLKYRYDKELYNAQRPVLRKIFEKDDVPSKTMVLCVVGVYLDDVLVSSLASASSNIELLLTDGWYTIRCKIDKMLHNLVCSGKIVAGTKIATSGAELIGCEQGVSPWEYTSAIRLKISGNSTRKAKWDARLGYHTGTIISPLSAIQVLGGKIAKLRVLVTRVYPALYVEKFEDGSTVTRSERLENIHQIKTESERQAFMEKLYEEVEKEFADQVSQDSEGPVDNYKRPCLDSGSQIAKMMKLSKDPSEFRATLTDSQIKLLEAHSSKNRDRLLQDIQTRLKDKIEKSTVCINRNVVCLLKIRVAGLIDRGDKVDVCKGMMSIWKPNDVIQEIIKEGAWIDVLNVIPTAVRYSEIQLSASRQSIFSTSTFKEPDKFKPYTKLLNRQFYTIKDLAHNPSMTTDYNEIDTIGLIFQIEPSIQEFDSSKQSFQNVFLADADKKIICANFWGGLQKFGYQNVLDTGQIIVCGNLQKRAGNTRKSIPQFRVTEFSYFTRSPKNIIAKNMLDDFNRKFTGLDRRKYCQECVAFKNSITLLKNNENISPYRFMNNDLNKNKLFIDSPLARHNKIDNNFNLTGLDFESTFKQDSQLSEEALKRKKKVNEKIARLKMYGEPPPLSPIQIINRSKHACSSYKSPLQSNINNSNNIHRHSKTVNQSTDLKCVSKEIDSRVNVTSSENTPQKCGVQSEISSSPVLLNRTYVKTVNPVKINFDVLENNDNNIDHFAEEFDGSPPLSLD